MNLKSSNVAFHKTMFIAIISNYFHFFLRVPFRKSGQKSNIVLILTLDIRASKLSINVNAAH